MNIFIHRRDLRYEDNTTLLDLYSKFRYFIPIFIFDPIQIEKKKNKYYSNNLVQFLCSSLLDLKYRYKKLNIDLNIFYGDTIKVLDDLNKNNEINSISFNIDYSPFSKNRDTNIIGWCNKNSINCFNNEDMLLIDINSGRGLKPSNNEPYLVFTPFTRNLKKYDVNIPNNTKIKNDPINVQR